ncbi:hypothetical protein [Candidatus Tisiphia endosymbiont of Hybos culiciformis]|uniref:hypothetical protein n=1 Tax=Candidatus Tisiphia endosymbiont of Hybos culiciformis TaxID=3139331 RepID=UPI003CCB000E
MNHYIANPTKLLRLLARSSEALRNNCKVSTSLRGVREPTKQFFVIPRQVSRFPPYTGMTEWCGNGNLQFCVIPCKV